MSTPSNWPLPAAGARFLTPAFMVERLARHPLTKDCYPTAMGHYPDAAGHRMARDRHDDNLLLYCIAGRGELTVGDHRWAIAPGTVMLLPQGTAHEYAADEADPWSLYWVHFQGSAAAVFMHYLGFRDDRAVVSAGVSPALVAAFAELLQVNRTGYSLRAFVTAANQLRYLLAELAQEVQAYQGSAQQSFDLEELQAFMLEHLEQPLTLDTLARRANMSKYHFSNRYKRLTGYSPIKHFLNLKMERACHQLDTSNLSVAAIASGLGYDDPLYFSRLFRKTIGLSPRQYRAAIRQ